MYGMIRQETSGSTTGREDFLNVVGRSGQPVYDYMEELFRGRCSTEEFMKVARQHGVERLERELTAKPGAVELLNCIKRPDFRVR